MFTGFHGGNLLLLKIQESSEFFKTNTVVMITKAGQLCIPPTQSLTLNAFHGMVSHLY